MTDITKTVIKQIELQNIVNKKVDDSTFSDFKKSSNTVAILGDSFDARSMPSIVGDDYQTSVYGIWNLTNMLMGQRMDFVNIDGVSGSGAIQAPSYASRVQASVYDHKPTWCAVRLSANDVNEDTNSLADLITAYTALFTDINNNGIKILACSCAGSTTYNTSQKRSNYVLLNKWLFEVAIKEFDIIALNNHYQISDRDSLIGEVDPALSSDPVIGTYLHPNLKGAFLIAQYNAAALLPSFPNPSPLEYISAMGTDDATVIDPNPINVGITGARYSSALGEVSDNMSISTTTTGAAECSKVARIDGAGYWQQVVWTPTGGGQLLMYGCLPTTRSLNSGVQVGDVVSFMFEFEMDGSTLDANAHYPLIEVNLVGTNPAQKIKANAYDTSRVALGVSGWRGVVATPKMVIPSGVTSFFITYRVMSKIAGEMTVRFGNHGMINYSR